MVRRPRGLGSAFAPFLISSELIFHSTPANSLPLIQRRFVLFNEDLSHWTLILDFAYSALFISNSKFSPFSTPTPPLFFNLLWTLNEQVLLRPKDYPYSKPLFLVLRSFISSFLTLKSIFTFCGLIDKDILTCSARMKSEDIQIWKCPCSLIS